MNPRNWPRRGIGLEKRSRWRSLLHPQSQCHAMKIVASIRMLRCVNLLTISYKSMFFFVFSNLRVRKNANPCEGLAF